MSLSIQAQYRSVTDFLTDRQTDLFRCAMHNTVRENKNSKISSNIDKSVPYYSRIIVLSYVLIIYCRIISFVSAGWTERTVTAACSRSGLRSTSSSNFALPQRFEIRRAFLLTRRAFSVERSPFVLSGTWKLLDKPSKLTILDWHLVYINGFILSASYLRDYWNAPMSNL